MVTYLSGPPLSGEYVCEVIEAFDESTEDMYVLRTIVRVVQGKFTGFRFWITESFSKYDDDIDLDL